MSSFRGIWVALVTPFRAGEIDFAALQVLVGKLLEDGVPVAPLPFLPSRKAN